MKQERIKQNFIEDKIRRYGVNAEKLARSLISNRGIRNINDHGFEEMLKGKPLDPTERTFEDFQQRERNKV